MAQPPAASPQSSEIRVPNWLPDPPQRGDRGPVTLAEPVPGKADQAAAGGEPPADETADNTPPVPEADEAPTDPGSAGASWEPPAVPLVSGPRPRRRWPWVAAALVVAGLSMAIVAAFLPGSGGPAPSGGTDPQPGERLVSEPLAGREQATFVLLSGATSVTVRADDLGDQLFEATTPEGGAHLPVATVAGDEVRLELVDSGEPGSSSVDIRLSTAVQWRVGIHAGAAQQSIDLGDGQVTEVELAGGASRIELTLPPPQGTTTVRLAEGVGQWLVHQVGEAPVRVRVGSGAGSVTLDGVEETGIAPGTELAPEDWEVATARVDLDAAAGMSSLVVERLPQ